ncbi:FecCD family ABC transporter permease [Piscibacillus halophilus]|uniref:Iron complex transport system permease protein n=1 Tax=Piscibacillus halophilus TaxID=571933 RepID=A0A1H9LMB8_9BACI|nr:iron ABC transporter permease [Piscibacillus halophilus]SER12564.1 iron complex transport system permease protein [Piscibacillus halophilus]
MNHSETKRFQKWFIFFIILSILIWIGAISLGSSSLSIDRLISTLMGRGTFKEEFILFSVRLPRMLVLCLAGAALATAGAILQTISKNDLADPGIIGINAGAGLGITIFYLFVESDIQHYAYVLPVVGFISALLTAVCVYIFSYSKHSGIQPVKLVLVGVGFASALSGLMMILISSSERQEVEFVAQWLAGSIWGADWPFIVALLPWLVIGLVIVFIKHKTLDIISMGEDRARGLGVLISRERLLLMLVAVALAAAAVSVTGGISFVGLMAPHIARQIIGPVHKWYLPIAILVGSSLLVLADTIGRIIVDFSTIPAGIIVALIGSPYFIYLLIKSH